MALDEVGQRLFLEHPTGEIWELDLASATWSRVIGGGGVPDASLGAAMVYDATRDQLIASTSAGLWKLPLGGAPQWTQISESVYGDEWAELVLDRAGDAVVQIGVSGATVTWPLSEAPGHDLSEGFPEYARRSGAAAVYDALRRRVVIHGGWNDRSGFTSSATVALALSAPGDWQDIGEYSGGTRMWHQAVVDPVRDRVIIFGGYNWPAGLDSLIARPLGDPSTGAVSLHAADGWGPSACFGFSFTLDPPRDRVLLYGGQPLGAGAPVLDQRGRSRSAARRYGRSSGRGARHRMFHTMLYDRPRDRMPSCGWDENGNPPGVWELAFTPELHWRQLAVGGDDDGSHVGLACIDETAGGGGRWVRPTSTRRTSSAA